MGVYPEDCQYLKFLSYEEESLVCFQFRVVPFGATCSPYLLQYTLKFHFSHHPHPLASQLFNRFYIDNYFPMEDHEEPLLQQKKEVEQIMLDAGMPLQEWVSSSERFNEMVGNHKSN